MEEKKEEKGGKGEELEKKTISFRIIKIRMITRMMRLRLRLRRRRKLEEGGKKGREWGGGENLRDKR